MKKRTEQVSVLFMLFSILFCVCLIAANLFATKQISLGTVSVTGGLIIFPISYIVNDCVCEVWAGFHGVFGLAPRVAAASFLAFLVGSFMNAYVMSRMKIASQGRNFSSRAIISTVAGETADSLIFFPLALGGIVPTNALVELMLCQILLKTLYEVVVLPVTIHVVHLMKEHEGEDVYDEGISYNIFKLA